MQTAAKEQWRCTQVSGIFWLRSWALPMPRLLTLLVADLPNSLWVWPASPRAGNPPKAHRYYGTGEPSLFSLLLLPYPVLQEEGPHWRTPQWQNGSIWLGRSAESFRENVWKMGGWVFNGGSSEEKEKEEEKYQREVVFCFHIHIWWLAAGMRMAGCPSVHTMNNWMPRHGFYTTKNRVRLGLASSPRGSPSSL